MVAKAEFLDLVMSAYQRLYDLVSLRTHPLAQYIAADPALSPKKKGWELHRVLLEIIRELDSGPQVPAFSREWRQHRLMVMRYVEGLDPKVVASRLVISRRQYYREHKAAMKTIADLLWSRYEETHPPSSSQGEAAGQDQPVDSLALLRQESSRISRHSRYTNLVDVIQGVRAILQGLLHANHLNVQERFPDTLPAIAVDRNLLRQVLLGVLGYLIERAHHATLHLSALAEDKGALLSIAIEPGSAVQTALPTDHEERLATFYEMATLNNTRIRPMHKGDAIIGFTIELPTASQRTVLVVDDNKDVLALFENYLVPHRYRVVTAQNAGKAFALACQLVPYTIILDLMMPGQDGWDLLQMLLNQPETRHIPIIVCSVLKQSELALLLGATAFLEKPITEQNLLATLQMVEGR